MKQRLAPVWQAQPNGTNAVENDQSRLDHTMQKQCNSTLHQHIKTQYSDHVTVDIYAATMYIKT